MTQRLDTDRLEKVGGQQGSLDGGTYESPDGEKWYIKQPASQRQAENEVIASRLYRLMGFDAAEMVHTDDGRVASRWREGLPESSRASALQSNSTALETFHPSAWIENWDVVGLVYDNMLYDPQTMDEPFLIDFGGSFDTRAQGGQKPFRRDEIMAYDGFTDPSLNASAESVFGGMGRSEFRRSKRRVMALGESQIREAVGDDEGAEKLIERRSVIDQTDYSEVF